MLKTTALLAAALTLGLALAAPERPALAGHGPCKTDRDCVDTFVCRKGTCVPARPGPQPTPAPTPRLACR